MRATAAGGRALLLLPRPLEGFILEDQARDLLRADGVVAADPPRVRYGAVARLPGPLRDRLAHGTARRLLRALGGDLRAVVIFHPVQWPLAQALLAARPVRGAVVRALGSLRARLRRVAEDAPPPAGAARRRRVALGADVRRVGQARVARARGRPRGAGRRPGRRLVPGARPGRGRRRAVARPSRLAHGLDAAAARRRADARARAAARRRVAREGVRETDPDFAWCRAFPGFVWLGRRSDDEAARLILCADVGILPFRVEPFNDAALPYRILKYARLGRRTVSPELAGVHTWDRAVTTAADADAFVAALRAQAGARLRPDEALRAWALEQTAERVNAPLWERLRELGVT